MIMVPFQKILGSISIRTVVKFRIICRRICKPNIGVVPKSVMSLGRQENSEFFSISARFTSSGSCFAMAVISLFDNTQGKKKAWVLEG